MESDFVLDIEEVLGHVESADVISLFFPSFRKALVLDMRVSATAGPLVKVLPMVGSSHERIQSIHRLRPGFPKLRNLTVIPWSRYVDSLVVLGVWDRIVTRFYGRNSGEVGYGELDEVLDELRWLEKEELIAAVEGGGYLTIWP